MVNQSVVVMCESELEEIQWKWRLVVVRKLDVSQTQEEIWIQQ